MTTLLVGDIAVKRVEEIVVREKLGLFPDCRYEHLAPHMKWMAPHFFDPAAQEFLISVHSWLLRTRHHTILIDTCAGNHKERPVSPRFQGLDLPYLERLKAAGVTPEEVDFVMCTHLHIDHVGWNTQLKDGRWVPTFPNAKYIFSRGEHNHWNPKLNATTPPHFQAIFLDSVLPVIEAGQAIIVDEDFALDDQIQILPTPGHSPGHMAITLKSGAEMGIFSGDVMHQPIQVYYPEWNSRFCGDAAQARQTRKRLLEYCADKGCWVIPAHFGFPHAGKISEVKGGFEIDFAKP